MTFDIEKLIEKTNRLAAATWHNRNLIDMGPLLPEDQDPSVYFKNNWLAVGQSFGLVASSGVGKSSISDQMAFHWALGDPFLAEPTRPLKISVIQAEDSDRDLKEQRDGIIRGMLAEGYSRDQIEKAIRSVSFPTDFIGMAGDQFLHNLTEYQGDCKFDLLFINPLQRFFGGDISSQEDTSKFCAGLDSILKHKDYGCTAGIVMHTPKFHSGNKENRQSVDDYAEYAMAGSQEWTAWVRAVINIQKIGASEDYFYIKASKRGKRLKWTDPDGNATTKRIFKHSDGFIYWQEVTDRAEIDSIPKDDQAQASSAKTPEPLDIHAAAVVWANNPAIYGMGANDLKDYIYQEIRKNGRSRADSRLIFDELTRNCSQYGLTMVTNKFGKKALYKGGSDYEETI